MTDRAIPTDKGGALELGRADEREKRPRRESSATTDRGQKESRLAG